MNLLLKLNRLAGDGTLISPAWACLLLSMACVPVQAQVPRPGPPTPVNVPLTERQQTIKDRVARLEDRMFQLSQAIKKAEPDKAARLLDSLGASRSLLVRQKIDEIALKLRSEQYADAVEAQEALTNDLRQVLKLMLEEPEKLEDRKREMERAEAARVALEKLVQSQRRLAEQSQATATTREQAEALRTAADQLEKTLEAQKKLRADTGETKKDDRDLQRKQRELGKETEALAKQIQSAAEPGAAEPAPDGPSSQVSGAAKRMDAAARALELAQADEAATSQKEAEDKLADALKQIKERLRDIEKQTPLDEQAKSQDETAKATAELAEQMQSSGNGKPGENKAEAQPGAPEPPKPNSDSSKGSAQDDSKPNEGQTEQGEGSSPEKLPGQKSVQGAVPHQQKAAEDLKHSKPGQAQKKQSEALKKLEEAQQQLSDTLEQMRKEQQEELLATLEARFRAMLEKQVQCTKAGRRLHELGKPQWRRADQLELSEVAHKQSDLSADAEKTLYILTEEGTTVIFPQIIRQVRDDARDVGARLAAAELGPDVLLAQAGIEQALRELIDAVVQRQKEAQDQNETQQSEGDSQSSPLLPGSAELKLLRSCQARVNQATDALNRIRTEGAESAGVKAQLNKLAERQDQVSNMARSMHESMTRPQ